MRVVLFLFVLMNGFLAYSSETLFITDIPKALALAKKTKKPLLIDFYGIWCPPCNELDETVYETPMFFQKSKSFVLLKVDADAKSSWEIKDKYRIGGYPTIIFANSNGAELYRIVGYRSPKEFFRVMDIALASKGSDLKKACESKNEDDLWRCALVCAEREEKECAEKAFKKLEAHLKPGSARYEEARTYFVENAGTEDMKKNGYEKLMSEFPASPRALIWAVDYLKLFESQSGALPKNGPLEAVLANYSTMTSDPRLEEFGISLTDLAQFRAELLERLGKIEESKSAWIEAANLLQKAAQTLPKGITPRGLMIERIACLDSAGDSKGALLLANEYRAKYPGEFTFHYWAASILNGDKKYAEALPIARQAYEVSYGDNRIRVATLLVNLLATIPDKSAAQKIYNEVTREYNPSDSLKVRTHRYLRQLEEAMKKL